MNDNNNQKQIQIEVPNDEMQGRYSNMAVIAHSPNDFFIDMVLIAPNTPKGRVQSRNIMTPENAKQLMIALQQNIHKYEMAYGEIQPRTAGGGNGPINFPIPKGQA
ncbi:MAG: DUF3467 domain-containing protein [Muribaculaceae bacterium]|nr:DUF3467 domain-containing protein [Muribaculaceae bacterium]